jgi:hypothetical protein
MLLIDILDAARKGMELAHMQGLYPAEVLLGPVEWMSFTDPTFMTATQVHEVCLKGKCELMGLPVKRMGAAGVAVRAQRTVKIYTEGGYWKQE